MTHVNDVELGRRLSALRVDPPHGADFDARLGERLLALEQGEAPPAVGARVIVGPWLRRGSVRLIGATALLLAGAAAAMEGGVVEWVQARVFQRVDDARPAPPPAETTPGDVRRARAPRLERAPVRDVAAAPQELDVEAALVPAVPLDVTPGSPPEPTQPLERRVQPSRRDAEGASRMGRDALVRERPAAGEVLRSSRASDEPIRVPRVAIERRYNERSEGGERRFERRLPQLEPRDMQRPLEHLREVARQRRERSAGERGSDPRTPIERLRERRERSIERRDGSGERERRDGERRERGNR